VTIRLSTLRNLALALLVLVGIVFAGWKMGLFQPKPQPVTAETVPDDGKNAAIAGMTALFTIDVTAGKDAWQTAVCSVSTENGCAFAQMFFGSNWDRVVEQKMRTQYEVTAAELYRDLGNGRQVWKITGTVHNLNDLSQDKSGDGYVLTIKEGDTWKFDHILFNQEVKALEALDKTPEAQP
jgi:hypothetical protein